jgi:predicted  nucleic acid-binding Zn-ribbon protein
MVQKKLTARKTKLKPASKPAKGKSIKPPTATLNSIQLTLNKVVDKLSIHDTLFEKIDQRFEKMDAKMTKLDLDVADIRLDHEDRILPALKESADESKRLHKKIDDVEKRLTRKIDEGVADLKVAITGHTSKLDNHETRISALESRPA